MPEFEIRTATLDDLPHILRHRRAMFEEMGHTDAAVLDQLVRISEAYLRAAIPENQYRGYLAFLASGRVVAGGGIVIAAWPGFPHDSLPGRAWLLNVYTDADYRRRGIAREITQVMIDWCRAAGFSSVSLHASQYGRPLYESMGFRPTNEMRLKLG